MRLTLVGDQFGQMLKTIRRSAFRLELQPVYQVTYERETVDRFLAGSPQNPNELPAFVDWYAQIKRQAAAGIVVERVRVFDDPPTPYQQWEAWIEQWNIAAGETIHTISRSRARRVGLLPGAGPNDFWLLDDTLLMTMGYDENGRRIHTELTDEEASVQQARSWRDLAVRTAREVSQ